MACAADEFFEVIRQLAEINFARPFWVKNQKDFESISFICHFLFSLDENLQLIQKIIADFTEYVNSSKGFCVLNQQLVFSPGCESGYINEIQQHQMQYRINSKLPDYLFHDQQFLQTICLVSPQQIDINSPVVLTVTDMVIEADQIPDHSITLEFQSSDAEELKNFYFTFTGETATYKVGEGESNHFQLPNDKKLLGSQFILISKGGRYYLRDLGFVHQTRLKLDLNRHYQLHEDNVIDLGKIVHYHFDKLSHFDKPSQKPSPQFVVMR